jgi:hypothetical protein
MDTTIKTFAKPKFFSKLFVCTIPGIDKQKIMSNYRYLENVQPGKLLDGRKFRRECDLVSQKISYFHSV